MENNNSYLENIQLNYIRSKEINLNNKNDQVEINKLKMIILELEKNIQRQSQEIYQLKS